MTTKRGENGAYNQASLERKQPQAKRQQEKEPLRHPVSVHAKVCRHTPCLWCGGKPTWKLADGSGAICRVCWMVELPKHRPQRVELDACAYLDFTERRERNRKLAEEESRRAAEQRRIDADRRRGLNYYYRHHEERKASSRDYSRRRRAKKAAEQALRDSVGEMLRGSR